MKDSSSASITFTFEDFELNGEARKAAAFVGLFPTKEEEPEPAEAAAQEKPAPSEQEPEAADEASGEEQSRKAFEDAYVQGEKAGYEMGMRRVESTIKRLEKQIEEVVSFRQTLSGRYEKLATEMALIFAEAVVLRECSERRDVLAAMIRKALEVCEDRGEIIIKVRTKDVERLEGLSSSYLKIIGDDTIGEPGFVIETAMGDIDGRISIQFEELKKALLESDAG
jgi:flagellar biosynthesis/type III secretory pathway protein FliH